MQPLPTSIFQRYILLLKAPKARATGRQSTDHACSMIQMIETMKENGDMYIVIGAFAEMDRLPDFDKMVAHPALLVPQKIQVDEDAVLPYFLNLVEAIPGEFNATLFFMAHNIPFHEPQDCVALYIWPHSIKISPDQSTPMTPQTIHFVTHKYSPKMVCRNRPRKIMMQVCLPWRTVYLTV
jgi:hypothetical protein